MKKQQIKQKIVIYTFSNTDPSMTMGVPLSNVDPSSTMSANVFNL